MAIQWIGLCVAAAMICALIRVERPEMATAVSLAVGAAAVALLWARVREVLPQAGRLSDLVNGMDRSATTTILRAAGITVIAELGGQLCRDAGETALAGRVALIARIAILMLCVPLAGRLVDLLWQLAP